MTMPEAFLHMGSQLHADIDLVVRSDDALFAYFARFPAPSERAIVIRYIEGLLAAELSGRELADIWSATGSDCGIRSGHERLFFADLLEALRARTVE